MTAIDKRHLHHIWTKFRSVRPWYFLAVFLVSLTVCVFSLRHNYQTMVSLRNQVYQADKNNGDVYGALQKLRLYVYHHMNTSLTSGGNSVYPPIQLKYTYDRLVQAKSAATGQSNASLYTDAENYCQALVPNGFSGRYRIPCVENYVKTHGSSASDVSIPDSLYKFDFISARWSPDLAGWSLILTIISFIVFAVSFALDRWFKKNIA